MPHDYEVGLFFHILGVFGIAGGATAFLLVVSVMRRAETVQEVRLLATLASIIEKLFPVAAIVLLVSGGYIVSTDIGYKFNMGWVNYSATALILGTIAGYVINGRRTDAIRTAAAAAPEGPVPQALAAQIHDPWIFGTTHALTLMVMAIIWNMTTKPGDAEAAIVIIVAVLIGAASAMPMVSRRQAILDGGSRREPARSK